MLTVVLTFILLPFLNHREDSAPFPESIERKAAPRWFGIIDFLPFVISFVIVFRVDPDVLTPVWWLWTWVSLFWLSGLLNSIWGLYLNRVCRVSLSEIPGSHTDRIRLSAIVHFFKAVLFVVTGGYLWYELLSS